jgi:hypothetical protein
MNGLLMQLLIGAYASVGVIGTVGYVPTIKDILVHKKMSANISSYFMWTFCTGVTFLYSMLMVSNTLLQIVTGVNMACCALVLGASLFIKYNSRWV